MILALLEESLKLDETRKNTLTLPMTLFLFQNLLLIHSHYIISSQVS